MSEDRKISTAVIKRLPRYYRYLGDLLDKEVTRISSKELSVRMGITASQIRQDLNNFGSFGQQGYGYNVAILYNEIKNILGLDKLYNLILIGAGNIGCALVNYPNFGMRGFRFVALFDKNPKIIGTYVNDVKVLDITQIHNFLADNHVDIAVLTLPGDESVEVAQSLVNSGIKGIWNFTHSDLKLPDSITVENVRLTDSLMTLSYLISEEEIIQRVDNDLQKSNNNKGDLYW